MQFGKFIGADLRLFLQLMDVYHREEKATIKLARARPEKFLAPDALNFSWCALYERPMLEHLAAVISAPGLADITKEISDSPNQVKAIAKLIDRVDRDIDEVLAELDSEQTDAFRKGLPVLFGMAYSVSRSLRSLLVYGCYLNDLIARVREHRDRDALFAAVKIDPTTMGCPSVIALISQATLAEDKAFFRKLRNALEGRFTKREQANFQKMRVIFQVLKETGAERLTDAQLYELFVNQLGLYASDKVHGDVRKNLRKLASQYLTQGATT